MNLSDSDLKSLVKFFEVLVDIDESQTKADTSV